MKNLQADTRSDDIQTLPLKELHCHARIENPLFMDKVEKSIAEFGLQNPIVVVPITIQRWRDLKQYNPDILPAPEGHPQDIVFQVRCGNNRVRVARELGFTHIDCIVVEKMADSNSICLKQRVQQTDWMHRGEFGKWL